MHALAIVCLPAGTTDIQAAVARAMGPYNMQTEVAPYRDYDAYGLDGKPGEHFFVHGSKDHPVPEGGWTWPLVAAAWNAHIEGEEFEQQILLDDDGRPYQVSTSNPHGEWDWYEIGGRWHSHFRHKREADGDPRIVNGTKAWMFANDPRPPYSCDALPINLIDLDATRDAAEVDAIAYYEGAERWGETITDTREEVIKKFRTHALTGQTLITLDGTWVEKPWDRENPEHAEVAAQMIAYLYSIPADSILVAVDYHH